MRYITEAEDRTEKKDKLKKEKELFCKEALAEKAKKARMLKKKKWSDWFTMIKYWFGIYFRIISLHIMVYILNAKYISVMFQFGSIPLLGFGTPGAKTEM